MVVGSADIDVPAEHSDYTAATNAGANKIVVDGVTHLSLFAHPDATLVQARAVAKLR